MKAARENWVRNHCRTKDEGMARGDNKKAKQLLNTLSKICLTKTSLIKDSNGWLLAKSIDVLNRLTEYRKVLVQVIEALNNISTGTGGTYFYPTVGPHQ